jgi:hypothetical protein
MEDALRHSHVSALLGMLICTSSCSWYKNVERSLVDDGNKDSKNSQSVPRRQYDQLLIKYEELSKKYEELKENPNSGKPSLVDDLNNAQGENFATTNDIETVDLFAGKNDQASEKKSAAIIPADLENQLSLYRKAMSMKNSKPSEATKIFQQLESQAAPIIKVRAKLQMGELLFQQGQYDLSLQVFEDIITKHSHSGIVLQALKNAVECADKLGTQEKKEQYASMLNDIFESN